MRTILVSMLAIGLAVVAFPFPARACSCAAPFDLTEAIDNHEAAFVGTLVEKRDIGGGESMYTFEVEEWVKGDLGAAIEVRSASDGAGCGFEFFGGERIGAFLRMERGHLTGGLCSQVDPDALLSAAHGPTLSTTGVGRLLVANASSGTELSIVDDTGALVSRLAPADGGPWDTGGLAVCPEGDRALQLAGGSITVWDLTTLEVVRTLPPRQDGLGASTISCRDQSGSSVWAVVRSETKAALYEVSDGWELIVDDLPGQNWHIGVSYVISQTEGEDDPILTDVETGEQILLHETPPDALEAINVAPHPTDEKVAMLETRFGDGPTVSTLFIVDSRGNELTRFDIPYEAYQPVWLDAERVLVRAYDWEEPEQPVGYVFEISAGTSVTIEAWGGSHAVADGDTMYGTNGGDLMVADLETGTWEVLATFATQRAGPLVLLSDAPEAATPTTVAPQGPTDSTVPPLVAPELGVEPGSDTGLRWLGGLALVGFLAGLFVLARRSA